MEQELFNTKKLYAVNHTDIALKKDSSCLVERETVSEHTALLKVFKSKARAEKFIKDWYEKWPDVGYVPNGGACINRKVPFNGESATVEYVLFGTSQVCEVYSLQEVDFDDIDDEPEISEMQLEIDRAVISACNEYFKKLDDLKTNDELLHRAISRVIGKKCCEITFEEEKQQLLAHPEVLEAFKLFFDGQMLSHLD